MKKNKNELPGTTQTQAASRHLPPYPNINQNKQLEKRSQKLRKQKESQNILKMRSNVEITWEIEGNCAKEMVGRKKPEREKEEKQRKKK